MNTTCHFQYLLKLKHKAKCLNLPACHRGLDLPQAKRSVVLILSHPVFMLSSLLHLLPPYIPLLCPKKTHRALQLGDHLLVPMVSTFLSLITHISAFCASTEYSQVSSPACCCSLQWKRSLAGCSAMVFGNWDGVPTAILSSVYSQGCSGHLCRIALLPLVTPSPLHIHLRPQLSSMRSYRLRWFWNPQVPMSKDLEGSMFQGNSRDLLV